MRRNERGVTMIELMVVVAIAALIITAFVRFFSGNLPFYHRIQVRQQVMSSSRSCMDTIQERLRNGKARTLLITTPNVAPIVPDSRADFVLQTPLPSGATAYAIYLDNTANILHTQEYIPPNVVQTRTVATNVTGLMFTGNSADPGIVGVTLRMDVPLDDTGDPTHVSTIILPNQIVHMVESQ